MQEKEKNCNPKDCKSTCNHEVDMKSLQKSKDDKSKIIEGNKIVNK